MEVKDALNNNVLEARLHEVLTDEVQQLELKTHEIAKNLVKTAFNALLGRDPEPAAIEHFCRSLDKEITTINFVHIVLGSQEFQSRHPKLSKFLTENPGNMDIVGALVLLSASNGHIAISKRDPAPPAPKTSPRKTQSKAIVISNCQTIGLANSLAQQNSDLFVHSCDHSMFTSDRTYWEKELQSCDILFYNPKVLTLCGASASIAPKSVEIPSVTFHGYHPDACYAHIGGKIIKTPMDNYSSIIALAAYKKGLSTSDTLKLYNSKTYHKAGYFNVWTSEKEKLLASLAKHDLEMRQEFREWTMRRSFMHSFNHPNIECIYDVARAVSKKAGLQPAERLDHYLPHDNLKNGPILPVYTEIADFLGVEGTYAFKAGGRYGLISLEEFVEGSFAAYAKYNRDELMPGPETPTVTLDYLSRYHLISDMLA